MARQKLSKKAVKPKDRGSVLMRLRQAKMAKSVHAYVRGSTEKFYEWLATVQPHLLPDGPDIWICGDCHVGNLGPIGDMRGSTSIQIRDFDQTVIGNPAHDLIRLGVSLATAARGSDLPGIVTARMVEGLMTGYLDGINPDGAIALPERPPPVHTAMKAATARTWKQLARDRLDDASPTIPLGKRFWPLAREELRELKQLTQQPGLLELVGHLYGSHRDDAEIVDAAYWLKGCSSLGRRRYAVLLSARGCAERPYRLLDFKEAVAPAAPRAPGAVMPRHNGERVVTGARHVCPELGNRMAQVRMLGTSFFVRELLPQDLKLDVETLDTRDAVSLATNLGHVVGLAHGQQMPSDVAQAWRRDLKARHGKSINAPFWLWTSIVDLIGLHERQYLEHCRAWAR